MDVEFDERFVNQTISDGTYSSLMDTEGLMDQWEMIRTPVPVLTILALYLLFVLKVGPKYMESREPYNLKQVMRVYNILQIIYNLALLSLNILPLRGYIPVLLAIKISCSIPKEFDGMDILRYLYMIGVWFYLLLKIFDLLDTVFMVLRKKNSHITFLHLYHHVGMVIFTWITFKYIKAVQTVVIGFINILVHALMYTYYFFSTFESFKKYQWLKRHLTTLQLAQFVAVITYMGLLYHWNCAISRLFTYMWEFNIVIIFCLFLNFYFRTYIAKSASTPERVKLLKTS